MCNHPVLELEKLTCASSGVDAENTSMKKVQVRKELRILSLCDSWSQVMNKKIQIMRKARV
jgi:hypothetical protein